ncbi:uncharacterized protein [Antedon mediterranea]|uniref:uncharacterized protein n=1 Tax=Antedon mediterranea TaxID=105859 RepID=UPI003AF68347
MESNHISTEIGPPLTEISKSTKKEVNTRTGQDLTSPLPPSSKQPHIRTLQVEKHEFLCWGCGEFGQNGREDGKDIGIGATLANFSYHGCYDRVKMMACGSSHTVVVTESNQVFAWGNGSSGQLGCGDKGSCASPQEVKLEEEHVITSLACGSRHTVLVTQEGKCFGFGNNFYAQLGYNFRMKNYKENQHPLSIFYLSSSDRQQAEVFPHLLQPIAHHVVKSVACGEKHTLFLFSTGQIAVCGQNSYGQLGTGDTEEIQSPKVNERLEDVVHIACGAGHSIATTVSGELYVWGNGRACGMRRKDILFPIRKFTSHENIIMVAAGSGHSLALTGSGSVYSFGGGMSGQLGHGRDIHYLQNPQLIHPDLFDGLRISLIRCGEQYCAALTDGGQLYMWGKNSQVIPLSDDTETCFYQPRRIDIAEKRLRLLACGSWHAIAVTGIPEWQGWPEDFSDSEVEDISDAETTSSCEIESTQSRMQDLKLEEKCGNDNKLRANLSIDRQKTVLSLGEFYAPTPAPFTPLDSTIQHHRSSSLEEERSKDFEEPNIFCYDDNSLRFWNVKNSFLEEPNSLDTTGDGKRVFYEPKSLDTNLSAKDQSRQRVNIDEGLDTKSTGDNKCIFLAKPEDFKAKATSKLEKGHPRQLRKPDVRPKAPPMPRSKTFTASNSDKDVKHTVSKSGIVDFKYMDNFVPPKRPAKKTTSYGVTKVRLQGSPVGDIISTHKHPAMHQPPKLTKAHTFYGRFNLSQRVPSKKNPLTFDPKSPQKFNPYPRPNESIRQQFSQSSSSSNHAHQAERTSKNFMARKPLSLNGSRPAFSSASSWQSRTKTGLWDLHESVRKKEDKP